jgi:hypothetical protein
MAKRQSSPASEVAPVAPVATETPVRKATPRAASIAAAREVNFGRVVTPDEVVGAPVLRTAAGVNPHRVRVYGYDTDTGRVPKGAVLAVVPGATLPVGVTEGQWQLLQEYAGKQVQVAYDNGVASRSVRRAYRAGAIRFIGQ